MIKFNIISPGLSFKTKRWKEMVNRNFIHQSMTLVMKILVLEEIIIKLKYPLTNQQLLCQTQRKTLTLHFRKDCWISCLTCMSFKKRRKKAQNLKNQRSRIKSTHLIVKKIKQWKIKKSLKSFKVWLNNQKISQIKKLGKRRPSLWNLQKSFLFKNKRKWFKIETTISSFLKNISTINYKLKKNKMKENFGKDWWGSTPNSGIEHIYPLLS